MVDLTALHHELHAGTRRLIDTLDALEPGDRATLATYVAHNFSEPQLLALGRIGLLALNRAMRLDAAERCEHAVARIDATLRRLPAATATLCAGVWVLSEGPLPGRIGHADANAAAGTVVIVCPRHTNLPSLCDYYRQCFEELPEPVVAALRTAQVSFLPIEQVRVPLWARLRSFAHRVAWA
ncbi:MAG: hypothetical protein JNK82_45960 [Myxococcaceae bacterium]|nr:hypothetical protein [Myxococcaceae bacterium]